MIIGEAPGRREDEAGKVFIGQSGQLLDELLENNGIDRKDIFIANAVSCRPPDNRTPKKKEIAACKKWLDHQIEMVKPKFILTLGNVPLQSLLGVTGVKKMRGKPVEKDGMVILPTFHPSFALRDPANKAVIDRDIRKFKDIVDFGGIPEERNLNHFVIDSWPKFERMLNELDGIIAYDLETSGLYPWGLKNLETGEREKTYITSIHISTASKQFAIPLNHHELMLTDRGWTKPRIRSTNLVDIKKELGSNAVKYHKAQMRLWDALLPVLDDCDLTGQNMKFDVLWTWVKAGHRLKIGFDTMLAHYLLDENALHDLEHLAGLYFGAPSYDISVEEKWGVKGSIDKHCKYGATDVFYTRGLRFKLLDELKKDLQVKRVFDKLMVPVANLFCEIEYHGVYINESKMDDAEEFLLGEIASAEKAWNQWGKGVNMSSPKQIGTLLYDTLKIKCLQLTPKGARSTSESTLNQIDHPCVASLLKYRGAKQQHSFFIEGWRPYIVDSRLHPSFKLHGTVTGRPSCENPNLQQVPRDPRIRSLITAPKGRLLFDADLSQIELRIAAWLAEERNMIATFNRGEDAHWLTCLNELARGAAEADLILKTATAIQDKAVVKSIRRQATNRAEKLRYADAVQILLKAGPDAAADIDKLWKELRKKAKAVNFGYLYGMWWKKFKIYARDNYGVNVTDEEAQDSRSSFFETYPDFPRWHDRQRRFARMNGFVRSPAGRKRRLPGATSKHDTPERREAERQSINSLVQSFASDLNLMAALQLREEFPGKQLNIVGTVHDAILFEADEAIKVKVAKRLLEIMRRPKLLDIFQVDIPVPIEGEVKAGPWSEGVTVHV